MLGFSLPVMSWTSDKHSDSDSDSQTYSATVPATSPVAAAAADRSNDTDAFSGDHKQAQWPVAGHSRMTRESKYVDDKTTKNCWTTVDHENFKLRIGPDYDVHGKKDKSGPCLFDVITVDNWQVDRKIHRIDEWIHLPEEVRDAVKASHGGTSDVEFEYLGVPLYFALHLMYPNYAAPAPWSKQSYDGPTSSWVVWAKLSSAGRHALKENTPAGKLLKRFLTGIDNDDKAMTDRMKWISQLPPESPYKVPMMLKQYNGKPMLMRPQSSFYREKAYTLCTEDCHNNNYAWRSGVWKYMESGRMEKIVVDFGFCIEPREEETMPEQLLFAFRVCHWSPETAPKLTTTGLTAPFPVAEAAKRARAQSSEDEADEEDRREDTTLWTETEQSDSN